MGTAPISDFWPERAGEWMGFAADATALLVALTVLVLWLRGRNPVVTQALRASRARTVGRVLRSRGWSRRQAARACRDAVSAALDGSGLLGVEGELHWLDATVSATGHRIPVAVHGLGGVPHQDLQELADGYRAMARRLRSRGLLGGGTAPLIADVSEVAERTAALLATHAAFARSPSVPDEPGLPVTAAAGGTRLELSHLRAGRVPGAGIDDLAVSHLHERWVVEGSLMEELCAGDGVRPRPVLLSDAEVAAIAGRLTGRYFDGALPSLHAAHRQRDPASGRTRLHLVLGEAAYSAVVATHYVGSLGVGRPAEELRGEAALLTLSCLPTTSDHRILAVRRSTSVMTDRGRWSPAVNGNLEMRARYGIAIDRDGFGTPDPLRAIAREAREELDLILPADGIEILGTARFDSDQEVKTTVLLTTCLLDVTARDVVARSRFADAAEGRWENQGEALALPVPRDDVARDELLAWALGAVDHQPTLTAGLVALLHPFLMERMAGDRDAVREHLRGLAGRGITDLPDGTLLLDRDAAA